MDTLETQRGLLAFIRTIERLMEKNLIIEDSGTLSCGKDELGWACKKNFDYDRTK